MLRLVVNGVLYQFAWFICVCYSHWSLLVLLLVLTVHFLYVVNASDWYKEAKFIVLVVMLGIAVDWSLKYWGVLNFTEPIFSLPLWLAVLWCCFATTLRNCLKFMQGHLLLSACIGAMAGGPTYFLGGQLNDSVSLAEPIYTSVLFYSSVWLFLFPALLYMARKL